MFKSLVASTIIALLIGCAPSHPAADFSSPVATYKSYLLAIKADDEAAARACWWISDDNRSGTLDVVVGMHAVNHRFAGLLRKQFGSAAEPYIEQVHQFTDAALDQELNELPNAKIRITGDTATVTLPDYPHELRRISGQWRLDFNASTGLKDPAEFFAPGSWGPMFAISVRITRELNSELERGDYKKIEAFKAAMDAKRKLFEASRPAEK